MRGMYVVLALAMFGIVRSEVSDAELKEAVIGTSIDMFKAVTSGQLKNKVVSPVGAGILLALLEQGAKDQSSQQLQAALRLSHSKITDGYGKLAKELQANQPPGVQLETATHMFASEDVSVRPEYQAAANTHFRSGVKSVPFDSQGASRAINSWAYKATNGKILSIVDSVSPPSQAILLANAIYFNSPWQSQFRAVDTEKESFIVSSNRNVTVNLMNQNKTYNTGSNAQLGVKWIHIPFKGGKYYLVVVLPDKELGLADALKDMTASDFKQILNENEAQPKPLNLYLPRFRFNSSTNLTPAFNQLGVVDVFDSNNANLSGISDSSSLKVADCFQKATINIDESGGDTAVSSGEHTEGNASAQEFRVDHPFLAVIAKTGGVPIIMSTVIKPTVG